MQIKSGKILAAIIALSAISTIASAVPNPLKSYDLYADTHANSTSDADNIMSEYYRNSMAGQRQAGRINATNTIDAADMTQLKLPELPEPSYGNGSDNVRSGEPRRNEYLRESSKKVYADSKTPAAWTQGPSFYPKPSLESIKTKYKKSNFAGCLQEAESYVRLHPNDTLGFYYLAMCYTKINDKENAIKAYEKVIALNANPMIVKYATNGRNCAMGSGDKCYENVNEPELIYPYANVAESTKQLTPVDPNVLIQRNLNTLYNQSNPVSKASSSSAAGGADGKEGGKVTLPFGAQDEELDKFINSPYGNGLSPKLDSEYKTQQLKKLQESINNTGNSIDRNIQNIKKFDSSK